MTKRIVSFCMTLCIIFCMMCCGKKCAQGQSGEDTPKPVNIEELIRMISNNVNKP